ncbi:MAG: glycoside hydrolase, family 3-like protein, partial [Acidobacteriaceae bacterium]|nr:glycoside hydrolase, family 3-like protein [Acidobacteriaceae bacterium]
MRPIFLSIGLILSTLIPVFAKDKKESPKPHQPSPLHLDRDGEKWAEKTLHKLSVEEKVGQLFMIWVRAQFLNVDSADYVQLRDDIRKYH